MEAIALKRRHIVVIKTLMEAIVMKHRRIVMKQSIGITCRKGGNWTDTNQHVVCLVGFNTFRQYDS